MLKEPTIRNSYQFPNVPSHEWQNWKVDNDSSILSGLVVKLNKKEMIEILRDVSASCNETCDNNDYHRSRQRQTFK